MSDDDAPPLSPKARAAIAALDYASPGLKAAADLVPAAEEAIDRRASIRVVARSLGKPSRAAAYLRRSLAQRHSLAMAGDACVACGATTAGVIGAGWSFVVPVRFFRGMIGERAAAESVETFHAMCGRCAGGPFRRQRRARRLIAAAVCGTVAGVGLLGAAVYWFVESKDDLVARGMLLVGAALILTALALIAVARWLARRSVPRGLRRAMPRWLRFEAWQAWFDRATA